MELSEVKKNDTKTPLQKVGEFLREARQGRNLSVDDLSSSLRIGKEQLAALESGDEASLPEKVFIKAMVRRIAEKLNLDTTFILEELKENNKNESLNNLVPKKEKQKRRKRDNPFFFIFISGLLGLTCSVVLLNYINKDYKESSKNQGSHIFLLRNPANKYY